MLYVLNRFKKEFVDKQIAPPENFFWDDENEEEQKRYRSFISHTAEIGKNASLIAHIPHKDIQRVCHYDNNRRPVRTPLFMDNL